MSDSPVDVSTPLDTGRATQLAQALRTELRKAVIGQDAVIDDVLTALIAGGHVLLEGVPGLGKTLLVRALARCFGGDFARIQFTPDLMPSDVTGHAVYDLHTEQFKLRKGPVFTHLLLADEINRAPAKTQAALLEAMQERQVTLEGEALPIGQHDNAWLLWYLNQGTGVTLLFNSDVDSLLTLLMRYFPQALVALLALIALALCQTGMRQGPIQAPAPRARRQLQEHLKASADFLLRRTGQGTLLHALQRDIQRAARRRHPGFEHLDTAEQWQVLERLTRQPSHIISQALGPLPAKRLSSADFSRQVACLQTLRNAL